MQGLAKVEDYIFLLLTQTSWERQIASLQFKIQNSKFKIKDSHPQGAVGLEPSPKKC
jgi:hypothetical protein